MAPVRLVVMVTAASANQITAVFMLKILTLAYYRIKFKLCIYNYDDSMKIKIKIKIKMKK